MPKGEIPEVVQEEIEESAPQPSRKRRRGGPVPGRLIFAALLTVGGFFGGRYLSSEAVALSYTYNSINLTNTRGMIGIAVGNRWRTHGVFSDPIREILEQVTTEYSAVPNDNPYFNLKRREVREAGFTDTSFLLEIGQAQFRWENIISHEGLGPDREFTVHTT